MSVETGVDFLLTRYAPFALWIAVGATVALIVLPIVYLLARGQAIRRSADGQARRGSSVIWLGLLVITVPLVVISWASVGGRWWLTHRNGVLEPAIIRPIVIGVGVLIGVVYAGLVALLRPGSGFSEFVNILSGGVRRRKDELGSAHFTDRAEYRRFAEKHPHGVTLLGEFRGEEYKPNHYRILGDQFSLSPEDAARGIITIGNPGSGKSQSVILPTIADSMRDGECLVVSDPQGELKPAVLDYARVTGHIVIIHDPTDDTCARFNLVAGVETVSNARALAEVLLPSTNPNDFWQGAARALLAASMMHYASIGEIVEKLGQLPRLVSDLEQGAEDARFLVHDFLDAAKNAPKQAVGVTATIMRALDAWADGTVRGSTAQSDFTAAALVRSKRPLIVLLTVPGRDRRALAPYLGAVLTKLLLDLDSIGERIPGGALPRPVKFVLEEFPAMGNLSVIVEQANLVRKRRISFLLACQTVGQLQNIYGRDGAATLLAGMATQIIFGGADKETAGYFSSLAGNQTRIVEKPPRYKNQQPQQQAVERPLLTHDQIISPPHAPQGNVIIFTRYVTESYAVNAVILARLTRMYERRDWKRAIARAKTRNPRLYTRRHAEKPKRKRQPATKSLASPADDSQSEWTFIRLRVVDDSPPPDQQNLVIPYPLEDAT